MSRFLIVGESVLDVISRPGTGRPRHEAPGGSPANVAVGLGRLGHDVSLWTHIGADPAGTLLRHHLTGSGVALLAPVAGVTAQALAEIGSDGSARYHFAVDWPRWPGGAAPAATAEHLHTGSLAVLLRPGADDVRQLLLRSRAATTISYDPNIRPALAGTPDGCRARVESTVALSDIVKASAEDPLGSDDLREVLSHAGLVAALTVARSGAAPPTSEELRALSRSA